MSERATPRTIAIQTSCLSFRSIARYNATGRIREPTHDIGGQSRRFTGRYPRNEAFELASLLSWNINSLHVRDLKTVRRYAPWKREREGEGGNKLSSRFVASEGATSGRESAKTHRIIRMLQIFTIKLFHSVIARRVGCLP